MKIVRRAVATRDSPLRLRPRPLHDERLDAVGPGKCIVNGTVWAGDLRPYVDAHVDALEPLVNGLTLGRTLEPEPAPAVLDLGRRWVGDVRLRLTAARDDNGDADVTAVVAEIEGLRAQLGVAAPNFASVADGLRRLRRAADAVTAAPRTNDAQTFLARSRDAARAGIAATRAAAARRWSPSAPTRDSASTEVRDIVHAANKATNMRDKIGAMNAANAAFHAERTRDNYEALLAGPAPGTRRTLERHIRSGTSGARTPAEINEANRRFWASRS